MQGPAKFLLLLTLLGGVLVTAPSAQARDPGGSHDAGDGGGTIIFIPPSGGGDYGGNANHIRNGGIDRYRGDISGSSGRQSSTGEFYRPSHSQDFIYRKRLDFYGKKHDGKYSDISKWRRHDFDYHKHKRHHHRHGKYQYYYAGWWYLDPWWTYGLEPYYENQLSCAEARLIVRQHYDRVRTIECRGRIYTFTAVDNRGRLVEMSVNSITGAYWRR
jgi:hypothetical protein